MATYKISNITNKLHKRDSKFNMPVNIEYIDDRIIKTKSLKAGEDMFLSVDSLPLSVHRLRIKKIIEIIEVSAEELSKSMSKGEPKPKQVEDVTDEEDETSKKTTTSTKKTTTSTKKITTSTSSVSKKDTDD